jgi:hypothetical protein
VAAWTELLDLPEYIGQVGATFRFDVVDGRTGVYRGRLSPLRDPVPMLEHDSTATISRKLSNLTLGVRDAQWFKPLTDRVKVTMVLGDPDRTEFPLGRYLVADDSSVLYSQGTLVPLTFYDDMFIIDQELETGFNAGGDPADAAIVRLLEGLPIGVVDVEASSSGPLSNGWGAGSSRGTALSELANLGGYFNPWFNHENRLKVVRAFEPGDRDIPDIDLDSPSRVYRESISFASDLVTAPNRFIVRSNSTGSELGPDGEELPPPPPILGVYDVPSSYPHSIAQRGFVMAQTVEAQVRTQTAAGVYARALGLQRTVYETCTLSTPPDPRHDGYQVIKFDGKRWLEIGWSMPLVSGAAMSHTLRRAYPSTGEEDFSGTL